MALHWNLLLLGAFIAVTAPAHARAEESDSGGLVAVLPLDTSHSVLDDASRIGLDEMIRTSAGDQLRPRGFTVLTGETTLRILEDNGVDPTKVCDSNCGLSAAKEMKAKMFVSGTVTTSESQYITFVRLFDGETGQQLGSIQLEGKSAQELRDAFAKNASAFFGNAVHAKAFVKQRMVLRTVGWTAGGTGLLALAVGGVLAFTVRSDTVALQSTVRPVQEQTQRVSSINSRVTAANTLFEVGGVLAATGIGLVVAF